MAFSFASASSEYCISSTMNVSAVPLLICAWYKPASLGAQHHIAGIAKNSSFSNYMLLAKSSGNGIQAQHRDGSATDSATAGTIGSAGVWHHAAALFLATNSRYAYLDGTAGSVNTVPRTAVTSDRVVIGANAQPSIYTNGDVAEVAFYTPTTKAEADSIVAALAVGMSPLNVRADILAGYWPLWNTSYGAIDLIAGNTLTQTNTPTNAAHPRVIYKPRSRRIFIPTAAVPSGNRRRRMLIAGTR